MLSPLESTLTRWRFKDGGERLVAIALKDDDGVRSVLPIYEGRAAHPMDWMPEASFLLTFEAGEGEGR